MTTINGIPCPNNFYNEKELCRSLRIGAGCLRRLEEEGIPYIDLGETHIYDPNRIWKWYSEHGRKKT